MMSIPTTHYCRQRQRPLNLGGPLELNEQRYEHAPPLPLRNAPHTASDDSPVAKKKEVEADVPPAISNDYECVGFDNPSFTGLQSNDTVTTTEVGGGDGEKVDLADDSL